MTIVITNKGILIDRKVTEVITEGTIVFTIEIND